MKLALLAAAAMLPLTAPAEAPQPALDVARPAPGPALNLLPEDRPGCVPMVVQIAGEDREYRGTRLDQQPPAQLLLAVERRVDGCREATIIRRDIGVQAAPAEPQRR